MPYLISSRNFAFLLTIADLWRVSSNANGVWFVHTPPFLIALVGWIILLLNTAMLFFTAWIGSAS